MIKIYSALLFVLLAVSCSRAMDIVAPFDTKRVEVLYQTFQSSAIVANTGVQQLGTYSLPAGSLLNNNDAVYVVCLATAVSGTTTKMIAPYWGGVALNSSQSTAATVLKTDAMVGRNATDVQYAVSHKVNTAIAGVFTSLTADDGAAINIQCQGSESGGLAGNITLVGMYVYKIRAP